MTPAVFEATVAEFRPTRSMVEPLAVPTYAIIGLGLVASAILVPLTGFHVAPSVWAAFLLWPFVAFAGMLLRRVDHPRAATAVEASALIYGQGFAFLLALFPLTALSGPFVDAKLAAADAALGFDWTAYARFVEPSINPLVIAYKSFNWQPLVLVMLLTATDRSERLWRFVGASALAMLLSCAIYPFAPAEGAFVFHHLAHYGLQGDGPRAFGPIISLIKAGHRTISPDLFTGFISMPSYHAAAAALFVWASWPLRYWRWPALVLNVCMVAAAPIVGGHYMVDVFVGIGVAVAAIYGAQVMTMMPWPPVPPAPTLGA